MWGLFHARKGFILVQPKSRRLATEAYADTQKSEAIADATTKYGGLPARVSTLETDKWFRGNIASGGEIDSLRGIPARGRYSINSTSVTGAPGPWLGHLDVLPSSADGRTIQKFTRSIPGTGVSVERIYSGGSWSGWIPSAWNMGLLATGIDWNALMSPALYGIQFTNHPNQMAPSIGTLEVLPSSGNIIHRFTEDKEPYYVWTRRFNGTSWSTPIRSDAGSGSGGSVDGFSIPVRGELQAEPATVVSKPASQIMMAMSNDRLRGWNQNTSSVSETRDDGVTWTQINDKLGSNPFAGSTIESVRQLDNEELLVTCLRGTTSRREIWVSDNLDDTAERTFTRTLEARAPYIKFTSAWSQSDHGSIVLVNEYGPKTPTWVGEPVAAGENARYTYLSTDYGRTWATVFDLNGYLTNVQGRASTDNQHLHGAAIDPYWDRLWLTFGDNAGGTGTNGIVYSDDLGTTWKTAHFYADGTNPPHQVVGIQPMPKCVLFFGDMGPDVVRIDRTEGKYKAGGYATPTAFDSTASGKHLCQGFMRAERQGDDAPLFAVWSSEGAAAPSFAVATLDGYTFKEIWRDNVDNPSGFGGRSIVGPTIRGQVIISSNDQKVAVQWSEIKTRATGY